MLRTTNPAERDQKDGAANFSSPKCDKEKIERGIAGAEGRGQRRPTDVVRRGRLNSTNLIRKPKRPEPLMGRHQFFPCPTLFNER